MTRIRAALAVMTAAVMVTMVSAQATTPSTFDYFQCYNTPPSERMPNTLDNLVSLAEKYEENYIINSDDLADLILRRYRKDDIVYRPGSTSQNWIIGEEDKETEKQKLIEAIIRPSVEIPANINQIFSLSEECSLHMMVSHSTDTYPQPGINELWDKESSGSGTRFKRSPYTYQASSSSNSAGNTNANSAQNTRVAETQARAVKYFEPALHPIERGVIETAYGPVAAGTLLAGIMTIPDTAEYAISTILSGATSYMPSEMASKTLSPIYAATLSGDLGQMALKTGDSAGNILPKVGPTGLFHNCSTCSQQYSLKDTGYSYLSRAELYAGIDALILKSAYTAGTGSYSSSLTLSQLLRLYYSEKGLPGLPEYKACNRMSLYKTLDREKIIQQALHFMYAYQNDFETMRSLIEINKDNFPNIETKFQSHLTPAVTAMEGFINSYNYDDKGYAKCGYSVGVTSGRVGVTTNDYNVPSSEGMVDLIAIYANGGTVDDTQNQRQMIGDVARRIGVNIKRSRIGVLRSTDGAWILPLTNISNVAEWACTFTMSTKEYGVGSSPRNDYFQTLFLKLTEYYAEKYQLALQDMSTSSGRSEVVLWQVPGNVPGDFEQNRLSMQTFRKTFPDVSIIFVGRNKNEFRYLMSDEDDFIQITGRTIDQIVLWAVHRIHTSPRRFLYPACNPNNSTAARQYSEAQHIYEGAVTPNFTTFIRIPPSNFQFSERVKLMVSGNVRTCFSRTNRLALEDYKAVSSIHKDEMFVLESKDSLHCIGGAEDGGNNFVEYKWLCDRNVSACNPIYISVTGISGTSRGSCTSGISNSNNGDIICEFPHQNKYQLSHEGMLCGSAAFCPSILLLLLLALLHYFFQ